MLIFSLADALEDFGNSIQPGLSDPAKPISWATPVMRYRQYLNGTR